METYIPISYLNDFIFCPRSIYFHQLYGEFETRMYQDSAQVEGKFVHQSIDTHSYSTKKNILQGIEIFCEQYNLCGKIDIFNIDSGILVERKKNIKKIYDGYVFQIYSQCFGLREMNYEVKELHLYSFSDNKKFHIPLPEHDQEMLSKFEDTVKRLNNYNLDDEFVVNKNKCEYCIYSNLCDKVEI